MKYVWKSALALGCCAFALESTAWAADSSPARKSFLKAELEAHNGWIAPATRGEKYLVMEASAFAFFRATDHLYFTDLQSRVIPVPGTWATTAQTKTWIQGDLHPQNIGYSTRRTAWSCSTSTTSTNRTWRRFTGI